MSFVEGGRTFIVTLHRTGRPPDKRADEVDWEASALGEAAQFRASEVCPGQWCIPGPIAVAAPDDLPAEAVWAIFEAERPKVPVIVGRVQDLVRHGDHVLVPITDVCLGGL